MKKIAIVGARGKMGGLIFEELKKNYQVVKIDLEDDFELAENCDLVIDFSTGENSAKTAVWCEKNKKTLIIGATGQTKYENKIIANVSKNIPLMKAGNFSLGVALMKQMMKKLKNINIENIAIFEKHHKNKKDSPSGTALELCDEIQKTFNIIPQISAFRCGEEIGTHEISIYLNSEVIKISHQAFSRKAFVEGVKIAVEYMLKKTQNGYYNFEKIIKKSNFNKNLFVETNENM